MPRIAAHLSKKAPLPGVPYSSTEVGAFLEFEVPDDEPEEVLRARVKRAYDLLETSIDEQLRHATRPDAQSLTSMNIADTSAASQPAAHRNGTRPGGCTQAQRRALVAICRDRKLELAEVLRDLGMQHLEDLSVRDASMLIDDLKGRAATSR